METGKERHTLCTAKVFLLAENRLVREVLARILRKQSDLSVAGIDRCTPNFQEQLAEADPDILLIHQDAARTAWSSFIQDALRSSQDLKIVLFGMEESEEIFLQAVRAGICGYLLNDAGSQDILAALRKVAQGNAVCPPQLCLSLFHFVANTAKEGTSIGNRRVCAKLGLSPRQQQLAALLTKGLTNKEIASSLNLSEFTVKNHVRRIMRRLNVDSRYEAVQTIFDNGYAANL